MFFIFSRDFVSGLYVYVRQAALSIDRAFSDDFQEEIFEYYSKRQLPDVGTILESLRTIGQRKVLPIAEFFSAHSVCLTQKRRDQLIDVLSNLQPLLLGTANLTQAERMELRLELSYLEVHLRSKLPNALVEDIECVEHYHQADVLELKAFRTIVRSSWPE